MEAGRVGDDEPTSRTASLAAVQPLLVIDIDLMGPFTNMFEEFYEGVINVINALWGGPMREMLKIDPSILNDVNAIYDLSLLVYFSLLLLFGLTYLGSFQLFPTNQKTDPYRFMTRALAATLSLIIINPPGEGTLFSLGAFGWALEIQNTMVDLFLGTNISPVGASSSGLGDDDFLKLALALVLLPVVVLMELVLLVVLAARQMVILLTYGLYPLFIAFWVADAGPLKHGKKLSAKFFKATGMLIPIGVVIAALFRVATIFLSDDGPNLDDGETAAETTGDSAGAVTAHGVDAAFQSGVVDVVVMLMIVPATCLLCTKFVMDPLKLAGAGAGAAAGMAKRGISKAGKKGKSAMGMGGGDRTTPGGGGGLAAGGTATTTAAHSGGRSNKTIDNSAPEPSQTKITQYDDGSTPDQAAYAGGDPPTRDTSDREYQDRDPHDDHRTERDGPNTGMSAAKEISKGTVAGTVGGLLGSAFGPAGTVVGAAAGSALGWGTERAIDRYGDGVAKRIPDSVRGKFGDLASTTVQKADSFAITARNTYDYTTGGLGGDGGSGDSDGFDGDKYN